MLSRRHFLRLSGAAGFTAASADLATARAPGENRFVLVLLRGGLDGLHAVAPYGDPLYARLRPRLAVPPPGAENGAHDLDGYFGLHSALAPLHRLYEQGELLVVPAAATRYRDRSHFDGQNMLENGSGLPFGARDGWLNRAIGRLGQGERRLGLALGPSVPLLLQGSAPVATCADSPLPKVDEDFMERLSHAYRRDPAFSRSLAEARRSFAPSMAGSMADGRSSREELRMSAEAAAELLARDGGPRIAVIESQGWDTHFGQERRLTALFGQLAAGLVALRSGLGDHWRKTVVAVVSEFGRTAAENGNRGTDHGVGGLALLLGGAVRGGRIIGAWPGLHRSGLHEGRDIRPTTDYESLFKAVLIERHGLPRSFVENSVFPDSGDSKPARDLFRG